MSSSERQWYVWRNQQQVGPMGFNQLQELARRKILHSSDWVWNPDTEDWVLATHVPELFWFPELQATKSTVPQRPPPLPNASLKPPSLPKKLSEPLQNDLSKLSNSIVAPSVQKKLKQNYFGRHWRGELPLYVSYWFNGTAGYIVITVVRHFLDYANQG